MCGSAVCIEVIDTHTAEPIGQLAWHRTRLRGSCAGTLPQEDVLSVTLVLQAVVLPGRVGGGFQWISDMEDQMEQGEELKLLGQTWAVQ